MKLLEQFLAYSKYYLIICCDYSFVNSAYVILALKYNIYGILLPLLKSLFEHPIILVSMSSSSVELTENHTNLPPSYVVPTALDSKSPCGRFTGFIKQKLTV